MTSFRIYLLSTKGNERNLDGFGVLRIGLDFILADDYLSAKLRRLVRFDRDLFEQDNSQNTLL